MPQPVAEQAITVEQSNADAIMTAIADIAVNHTPANGAYTLLFQASKIKELPTPTELVKFPFFCVRIQGLTGYAHEGAGGRGGRLHRLPGWREPVWRFECLGLWSYDPSAPHTAEATDAMIALESSFTNYTNLEGTCQLSLTESCDIGFVPLGGKPYRSCQIVLSVYERLTTIYFE